MKLKEVISIIRFNTSTTDDLSGKSVQNLFTNSSIVQQLKIALDRYASHTKALEKVYSSQAYSESNVVAAPPDIIRGQGLRFLFVYNKGLRYPVLEKDANNIYGTFYVQNVSGIPGWFLYWGNQIQLFPTNSLDPATSTLASDISTSDSTIELADDITLALRNGSVTIGDEKITYEVKSGTTLSGCTRGAEDTVAAPHNKFDVVTENNVVILYRGLHWCAKVSKDDRIDAVYADKDMDVPDEYIPTITDYASYMLLSKVSPDRAAHYKMNYDEWLEEIKYQIQKGRSDIKKTDEVRGSYFFELEESPYRYLVGA